MARKQKNCVDYFPHDCHPTKILRIITKEFGNVGYAFFYRLMELLGRTDNHNYSLKERIDWLDFCGEMDVEQKEAEKMIEFLVYIGELDKEMWEQEKRLWSQNFVERLAPVYDKRTRDLPDKYSFRHGNPRFRVRNPISVTETPVSGSEIHKVKEIKEKKRKVEESVETLTDNELSILQDKYPKAVVKDSYQSFTLFHKGYGRTIDNLSAAFEKWLIDDITAGKHKRQLSNDVVKIRCLKCDATKNVDKNNAWKHICDQCDEPMVSNSEYKHTKSMQNAPPYGGD